MEGHTLHCSAPIPTLASLRILSFSFSLAPQSLDLHLSLSGPLLIHSLSVSLPISPCHTYRLSILPESFTGALVVTALIRLPFISVRSVGCSVSPYGVPHSRCFMLCVTARQAKVSSTFKALCVSVLSDAISMCITVFSRLPIKLTSEG